jgi:GTP-binding protein
MKVKRVEFAGAVATPGGAAPAELPQVAFSGRSNVGKSSLINRLLGRNRSRVARVSATPGKTQEINFYHVVLEPEAGRELTFFLVDLPGYGYARVPEAVRAKWKPLIEAYLGGSRGLRGVVQLIDARHPPTAEDRRMVDYLAGLEVPALFALTKVDKLKRAEKERRLAEAAQLLELSPEQIVAFSATTGEGREELLDGLVELLSGEGSLNGEGS